MGSVRNAAVSDLSTDNNERGFAATDVDGTPERVIRADSRHSRSILARPQRVANLSGQFLF